jgi:hypothetical protein
VDLNLCAHCASGVVSIAECERSVVIFNAF